MPLNRMGIVPGTIGDMIVNSQQQMRQKTGMRPMQARRVRMDEEVIRPVTDYRPTPMIGRRRNKAGEVV